MPRSAKSDFSYKVNDALHVVHNRVHSCSREPAIIITTPAENSHCRRTSIGATHETSCNVGIAEAEPTQLSTPTRV